MTGTACAAISYCDESTPLGRTSVRSVDPIELAIEGGAFENAKAPRQLSDRSVREVTARLLFRAKDRLSGRFDGAPADGDVPLAHNVAWDVYAVGRAARAGVPASKARRLYHFRNRHGFTDAADAAALIDLHEGAIDMVIATGAADLLSSTHPEMRVLRIEQLIAKESLFRRVEEILKGQPALAG